MRATRFASLGVLLLVSCGISVLADTLTSETGADGATVQSASSSDVDKRYLAALAKNGRLPKFATSQKRSELADEDDDSLESPKEEEDDEEQYNGNSSSADEEMISSDDSWMTEDKRHIGAFLRTHGRPNFSRLSREHARIYRSVIPSSLASYFGGSGAGDFGDVGRRSSYPDSPSAMGSWRESDKRNIAALARLGRLSAMRAGRPFAPTVYSGSKREVAGDDSDCIEGDDDEENWTQEKRYVAALARGGRLPPWHPRRGWWENKRDLERGGYGEVYWPRAMYDGYRGSLRLAKAKSKRCKKSVNLPSSEDMDTGELPFEKRNVAALARKGLLPWRPFVVP